MRLVEELFPRTIVMDDGCIVADGMTKEILDDEAFLKEHGLEKP
jgi:energy-coupling factor transporter ATP-binding protein EcfA2